MPFPHNYRRLDQIWHPSLYDCIFIRSEWYSCQPHDIACTEPKQPSCTSFCGLWPYCNIIVRNRKHSIAKVIFMRPAVVRWKQRKYNLMMCGVICQSSKKSLYERNMKSHKKCTQPRSIVTTLSFNQPRLPFLFLAFRLSRSLSREKFCC